MFTDAPEFRLWLFKNPEPDCSFSIRWQVMGGRGTLLLPRGGGTDAAPAAASGTHTQMSQEDLAQSRFVVVSQRSNSRNQFVLGPFDKSRLDAMKASAWTALIMDQGGSRLTLSERTSESPQGTTDPHTQAISRIDELERALAAAQQRVATLTRRVAILESEIDAAGDTSAG
jgi:hypothetical protein